MKLSKEDQKKIDEVTEKLDRPDPNYGLSQLEMILKLNYQEFLILLHRKK